MTALCTSKLLLLFRNRILFKGSSQGFPVSRRSFVSATQIRTAGPSDRAVKGVVLQPLACWNCGLVSHRTVMDVRLLWALCCQVESLRRADHSPRGVLPTVVRRVWSINLVNEEALPPWGGGATVASKTNQIQIRTMPLYGVSPICRATSFNTSTC